MRPVNARLPAKQVATSELFNPSADSGIIWGPLGLSVIPAEIFDEQSASRNE